MFADMLGSVRAVTGEKPQSGSASITECYDYLPFGRMLGSSDNGRNTGCFPASPDSSQKTVLGMTICLGSAKLRTCHPVLS